ncbi:calcium/proton exchanger [Infundibulicybe gibba]|nr:calcium/proton exchanger [Infundibulicybe gibba]
MSETTHLLSNGDHNSEPHRPAIANHPRRDENLSWSKSYYNLLGGGYQKILLVFVPLSILSCTLGLDAPWRFGLSFAAILSLSELVLCITEELSYTLGHAYAILLDASFGNAIEIIVGVIALLQGQLRVVQTVMLGSVLTNILLVLGAAFLAAGMKYPQSKFVDTVAQISSSLMVLSCITMIIPAAYHNMLPHNLPPHMPVDSPTTIPIIKRILGLGQNEQPSLLLISRGTSILLLALQEEAESHPPRKMTVRAAVVALILITGATIVCASCMVDSIEGTATYFKLPLRFFGMIMIPICSNLPTLPLTKARQNRMDLVINICTGSSIQIALLVLPLLVIIGWITGHELSLFFSEFETIIFFTSIFLVHTLIQDGKSNYMEGLMLVVLYCVIALSCLVQTS